MHAVDWLSSKLGLNIGGRSLDDSKTPTVSTSVAGEEDISFTGSPTSLPTQKSLEEKLSRYWRCVNHKVSGLMGGGGRCGPTTGGGIFGTEADNAAGENTELDENGLPLTKNWFFFDQELNRWAVTPDAPESIRREFEQKLQEEEATRLGYNTVAPPPPPPRMTTSHSGPTTLFGDGGNQNEHHSHIRNPQYAMPNYFNSTPVQQQHVVQPPAVATFPPTPTQSISSYPPPQRATSQLPRTDITVSRQTCPPSVTSTLYQDQRTASELTYSTDTSLQQLPTMTPPYQSATSTNSHLPQQEAPPLVRAEGRSFSGSLAAPPADTIPRDGKSQQQLPPYSPAPHPCVAAYRSPSSIEPSISNSGTTYPPPPPYQPPVMGNVGLTQGPDSAAPPPPTFQPFSAVVRF